MRASKVLVQALAVLILIVQAPVSGAGLWPLWGSARKPQAKLVHHAELMRLLWGRGGHREQEKESGTVRLPRGEGGKAEKGHVIVNFFAVCPCPPHK
jgi:hypothetical protein